MHICVCTYPPYPTFYSLYSLYEKVVLETALLIVLGQRVSVLNGEGGEFVQAVHTASKLSHGNFPFGKMILHVPTQLTLGCKWAPCRFIHSVITTLFTSFVATLPWFVSLLRWIGPGRMLWHFRVVQDAITGLIHNHKKRTNKNQVGPLII